MVTDQPPELADGQDDDAPDVGLLTLVVLRLLDRLLAGEDVEPGRIEAVRNAVHRYREAHP
jgi:hypothetical protein